MRRYQRIFRLIEQLIKDKKDMNGKVKMYCVGVNKKEFLFGENKYIVSRQIYYNYPHFSALHAELDYYHKAKKEDFEAEDIFIFGYRKKLLENTKPCIYCASLLAELKFKRIHFYEKGKITTLSRSEFIRLLIEDVESFKDYRSV